MKLSTTALALACALPFTAHATTTNWAVHDTLEVAATITPVGAFTDTYLFSLLAPASLFSTAVSNRLTQVLGLSNFKVTLFVESGVVDGTVGSFSLAEAASSGTYAFGSLAAGDYYYEVTGTGTGTLGGFYSLSSTIAPVAEPQTLALLFGGLGAMGFMVRRRRQG